MVKHCLEQCASNFLHKLDSASSKLLKFKSSVKLPCCETALLAALLSETYKLISPLLSFYNITRADYNSQVPCYLKHSNRIFVSVCRITIEARGVGYNNVDLNYLYSKGASSSHTQPSRELTKSRLIILYPKLFSSSATFLLSLIKQTMNTQT